MSFAAEGPRFDGLEPGADEARLSQVPAAPRTPSVRAKRLVFGYTGKQSALLIIGLVFTVISVPGIVLLGRAIVGDMYLSVAGEAAEGTITSVREDMSTKINGRHPTEATFSYQVDGAPRVETSSTTDDEVIAALRVGERVPIEVAGSFARVKQMTFSSVGAFGLFGLIFPIVGGLMTFFAVRGNRREIAAFTHGTAVAARVTSAGYDKSTKINGRNPFQIAWEFTVETDVFHGSISSMEASDLQDFVTHPELIVLYLPENPRINTIYVS